jgi:hypothetical protein
MSAHLQSDSYENGPWPNARPLQFSFLHPQLALLNRTKHKHKLKERFHFKEHEATRGSFGKQS